MTILIADDHPTSLKLLRAQLEAEGMTVLEAGDGVQALAVLERVAVDIIVSDILMPNMDGYQLCHTLRKSERFKTIPCILYSSTFASDSGQQVARGFGADRFLKKPALAQAMLAALHEVMRETSRQALEPAVVNRVQHLRETRPYSEHLIYELERQNLELDALKSELLDVNGKLLTRTKELEESEAELRESNDELERRVRARTAELEAANEDLESFSFSVSHDLRAPLRGITGFTQFVLSKSIGQLDEVSKRYLQRVVDAVRGMTQLIDAFLSLSKATRAEIGRGPINLSALAQTVLDELAQASSDRFTEIVIQPDLTVEADAVLFRIVATNLLSNAWKFTRKTAHPRIELGTCDSAGERTYFVRDNGAGFDMTCAGKLFGAFQRLHSLSDFEGSGVGLATVQRIIHRHGGKIWAEGAPGQGATFYFTMNGSNATLSPA